MITVLGMIVAAYAACRLLTLPFFLPRRPDGSLDRGPFAFTLITSVVGTAVVLGLTAWLWWGGQQVSAALGKL